jgi:hypothetical protein
MGMRYIDPYQLTDKVDESMRDNPHEGNIALNHRLEHEHFLRMIALAPSADVEPVVHARWIYKLVFGDRYHCSNCNNTSARPRAYCAECGAKMEAKVEYTDD